MVPDMSTPAGTQSTSHHPAPSTRRTPTPATAAHPPTAPHADHALITFLFAALCAATAPCVATAASITSIAPTRGSAAGGTLLTLRGTGFATNGVDASQTRVLLGANDCTVIDYFTTDSTLVCETPPYVRDPPVEPGESFNDEWRTVSVTTTNAFSFASYATCAVEGGCSFRYRSSESPTLERASGAAAASGEAVLTVGGNLYGLPLNQYDVRLGEVAPPDVRGAAPAPGTIAASSQAFRCDAHATLQDPEAPVDGASRDGVLCYAPDVEAGRYNVSVTLLHEATQSKGYGRAMEPEHGAPALRRVSPQDGSAYMTTLYPVVTGLSQVVVGTTGGASLTVLGSGFAGTVDGNEVSVYGRPCDVTSVAVTGKSLTCTLPAAPDDLSAIEAAADADNAANTDAALDDIVAAGGSLWNQGAPAAGHGGGGRGLLAEIWLDAQVKDEGGFTSHARYPEAPDIVRVQDEEFVVLPAEGLDDKYVERVTGILVAPVTANYTFYLQASDWAELYLSPDASAANLQSIAYNQQGTFNFFSFDEQVSDPVWLEAGQRYRMVLLYDMWKDSKFAKVAMRIAASPAVAAGSLGGGEPAHDLPPGTQEGHDAAGDIGWVTTHAQALHASLFERQTIDIEGDVIREVQEITITGVDGGHFRLTGEGFWDNVQISDPVPVGIGGWELRTYVKQAQWCQDVLGDRFDVFDNGDPETGTHIGYRYVITLRCPPKDTTHPLLVVSNDDLSQAPEQSIFWDVERTTAPSTKVSGSFRVGVLGEWTDALPFDIEEVDLGAALMALPTVGRVAVGDVGYTTDGRLWRIDFYEPAGDLSPVDIDASGLAGPDGLHVVVTTEQDGSADAFFDPMPADLFELPTAQGVPGGVEVRSNGITAACARRSAVASGGAVASGEPKLAYPYLHHSALARELVPDVPSSPVDALWMHPDDPECDDCERYIDAGTASAADGDVSGAGGGGDASSLGVADAHKAALAMLHPCALWFNASMAPTLTGVSPATVTRGDTLTVTGTGFLPGDMARNAVHLGNAACNVTYASDTEIECTVPHVAAGTLAIGVTVEQGRGTAVHVPAGGGSGPLTVTYVLAVDAVSAGDTVDALGGGSIAGTTLLTITGTGFASSDVVTVGGEPCAVESVSSHSVIHCLTPALADAANAAASTTAAAGVVYCVDEGTDDAYAAPADVSTATLLAAGVDCAAVVAVNGVAAAQRYHYASSSTPTVASVSPDAACAASSSTISITGTLLLGGGAGGDGSGFPSVLFGDIACDAQLFDDNGSPDTDAAVTCVVPRGQDLCRASDDVRDACDVEGAAAAPAVVSVHVPALGAAVVTDAGASELSHGFTITDVSPRAGSLAGGTRVTITGGPFSTTADVGEYSVAIEVNRSQYHADGAVADAHKVAVSVACVIDAVSATQITCNVDSTPKGVLSTPWDLSGEVRVALHGFAAACVGSADADWADAGACTFTFADATTPTVTALALDPGDPPAAGLHTATPPHSHIDITGTGLMAPLSVYVGAQECPITSHTEPTALRCEVPYSGAGNASVTVFVDDFGLALHAADAPTSVELLPRIDHVSPLAGSTAGGTEVTITGVHLAHAAVDTDAAGITESERLSATRVVLGEPLGHWFARCGFGSSCDPVILSYSGSVLTASPTQVVFRTPTEPRQGGFFGDDGEVLPEVDDGLDVWIEVTPRLATGELEDMDFLDPVATVFNRTQADDDEDFDWSAAAAFTPTLIGLQPSQGFAGDVLNVSGSGFGADASALTITVGAVDCAIAAGAAMLTAADGVADMVQCTLGELPAGFSAYPLVHVAGKGYAASASDDDVDAFVAAADDGRDASHHGNRAFMPGLEVDAVSGLRGGIGGGWELTFEGRGFPTAVLSSTRVTMCSGTIRCDVTSASYSSLTCETPRLLTAPVLAAYADAFAVPSSREFTTAEFNALGDIRVPLSGDWVGSSSNLKPAMDGNVDTQGHALADPCHATIDLGEGARGVVYRVRYYPSPEQAASVRGGRFSGSVDDESYVVLATVPGGAQGGASHAGGVAVGDDPHEGWNVISIDPLAASGVGEDAEDGTPIPAAYRYLRYEGPDGARCEMGEVEFVGVEVVPHGGVATDGSPALLRYAPPGEGLAATDAACNVTLKLGSTGESDWGQESMGLEGDECADDPFGGLGGFGGGGCDDGGFGGDWGDGGLGGGWRRVSEESNAVAETKDAVFEAAPAVSTRALAVYRGDLTPVVSAVTPTNGSSLGGTEVTVSGSGFDASAPGNNHVALAGIACPVHTASDTELVCTTTMREADLHAPTVEVTVDGRGSALVHTGVRFRYLDRWSSLSTWFASDYEPPIDGDSVVIPEGQAVLLDVTPPPLFLLLVQGTLVFDRRDLALDAHYFLVKGGTVEIGTADDPFLHRGTITMHGDRVDSVQLPMVGAKVIAVMNRVVDMSHSHGEVVPFSEMGVLDVHGAPRLRTWVKLDATAEEGDTLLHVADDVDFAPGERLLVTSSSSNNADAETVTVRARLGPRTLELEAPLRRTHASSWYHPPAGAGGRTAPVDMRVEVALLSRNVVIQGDEASETQLFGVHTGCFHGGACRIENAEFRRCGQAFVLGKYCTHMHMAGSMAHSYIAGNSIHRSFQRAVTIHGSHDSSIRDNVAYDTLGHTYFVEDGVESRNSFENNLGAGTHKCHSCLKSDTKATTFWTTSAANYWRGNVAAGSDVHGFWFELPEHPGGPSATDTVCPSSGWLGEFSGNTAHSNHGEQLRIYPVWNPREDPCDAESAPHPVYLRNFTVFAGGQFGVFIKEAGDVHIVDSAVVAAGSRLGFSWEKLLVKRKQDKPFFDNVLFVATLNETAARTWEGSAMLAPQNEFFYVRDLSFVNYGAATGAVSACTKCGSQTLMKQGAYTYRFKGLRFVNSPKRVFWTPNHKQILFDIDGSLTGEANGTLTPFHAFNLWEPVCTRPAPVTDAAGYEGAEVDVFDGGILCDHHVRVRRVAIDAVDPPELDFVPLTVHSDAGVGDVSFKLRDMYGWVVPLVTQRSYRLSFAGGIDWQHMRVRLSHPDYLDESVPAHIASAAHTGASVRALPGGTDASPAVVLWGSGAGAGGTGVSSGTVSAQPSFGASGDVPEWLGISFDFTDERASYDVTHNGHLVPTAGEADAEPSPSRLPLPTDSMGTARAVRVAPTYNGTVYVMLNTVNSSSDGTTAGAAAYAGHADRYVVSLAPVQCPDGGCPVPPPPLPPDDDDGGAGGGSGSGSGLGDGSSDGGNNGAAGGGGNVTAANSTAVVNTTTSEAPETNANATAPAGNGTSVDETPPTPVGPPRWSNPATWPSGAVPVAGEDVTIPYDAEVMVDVSTAVLGELSVDGVLTFADNGPDGAAIELHAHGVVVWGRLSVGSELEPYHGSAAIVLHGNRFSRSVIVSNDLFLGSKVMAVLGELELVGADRGATWARVASTATAGSTEVTVEGGQWVVGDVVVLSQTEYASPELEQVETATVAAVGLADANASLTTLTLAQPLQHTHFADAAVAYTDADDAGEAGAATGAQTVALQGAVGRLSHNVVVRGHIDAADTGDEATYGGHIVVAEVPPRVGRAMIANVELRDMGQATTEHAALTFRYLTAEGIAASASANAVRASAFRSLNHYGVLGDNAPGLRLHGNVFHRARRAGVQLSPGCTGASIRDNLVIGVFHAPEDGSDEWPRPVAGFYLDVYPLAELSGNVVGGSTDAGFVLLPPSCDDSSREPSDVDGDAVVVRGNEAHGCVVGAMLRPHRVSSCRRFRGFSAWKNSHIGVAAVDQVGVLELADVVVADNHIGINAHFVGSLAYELHASGGSGHNGDDVDDAATIAVYHNGGGVGGGPVDQFRVVDSVVLGSSPASDAAGPQLACNVSSTCLAHSGFDTAATGMVPADDPVAMFAQDEGAALVRGCASVFGDRVRRVGIVWPQYGNKAKTCEGNHMGQCRPPTTVERLCALPWENRLGTAATLYAETVLDNVAFAHWRADECGGAQVSRAIAANPAVVDISVPVLLSRASIAASVDDDALLLMSDLPDSAQRLGTDCGTGECDSFAFGRVVDVDGHERLTGRAGGTIVGNNPAMLRESPACTQRGDDATSASGSGDGSDDSDAGGSGIAAQWLRQPTFACPDVRLRSMVLQSRDSDRASRVLGPVLITRVSNNRTYSSHGGYMEGCGKRSPPGWYPFAVEPGHEYGLRTTNTLPARARLHFFSDDEADAVLVHLAVGAPNRMDVFVGGHQMPRPPTTLRTDERNAAAAAALELPSIAGPAGTYVFDPHARVMHVVLRGGGAPGSHAVDIVRIPVVAVSMHLDVTVEDFYEEDLVANLAALLGIDADRIKVVGVRLGSVIVDFEIEDEAAPSVEAVAAEETVVRLEALTATIVQIVQAGELDVGYEVLEMTIEPPQVDAVPNATAANSTGADGALPARLTLVPAAYINEDDVPTPANDSPAAESLLDNVWVVVVIAVVGGGAFLGLAYVGCGAVRGGSAKAKRGKGGGPYNAKQGSAGGGPHDSSPISVKSRQATGVIPGTSGGGGGGVALAGTSVDRDPAPGTPGSDQVQWFADPRPASQRPPVGARGRGGGGGGVEV